MIVIEPPFNGPPGVAHGGVASGRLAELVDPRRATVRLHAPVPLGEPLVPRREPDGSVRVLGGGRRVATVRPSAPLTKIKFSRVPGSTVIAAEPGWLEGRAHPFPTCFACGHGRADGRGLSLRPSPIRSVGVHAARWTPAGDGLVDDWVVWAALDCPSGFPAMAAVDGRPVVTGELSVEIRCDVRAGHPYQVVSRCSGRSGRRFTTEVALLDSLGQHVAVGSATWFAIDRAEAA